MIECLLHKDEWKIQVFGWQIATKSGVKTKKAAIKVKSDRTPAIKDKIGDFIEY